MNAINSRATKCLAASLGILALRTVPARADNPIVQTNYTADPAPVVYGDTLYLYTSHDEDVTVNNFYTMNDWRLYTTKDMVNWTDHGSPAGLDTFSWGTDSAWAPHAIERNGEYFLYVPLNNNTGSRIGVGVADDPFGPFEDPLGTHLAQSGTANIDPSVFIDDDGQAYMYWGNATLKYVRLNEDMTSYAGSITNVDLSGFTEGPWIYKRDSTYYMLFAGMGGGTEKISYATSDSPTGPWTVRGDIMAAGPTYTNHAGVVDYMGHSYFFYHNSALPGGNDFKRSVCVQEFTYGSDGSIPTLSMNSDGPDAIATLNPFDQVEAETIAFSEGLKTEACDDTGGGQNVTRINAGDYIKVKNVDFIDGVTSFEARVAESAGDAAIELHLDGESGESLGTCDVSGKTDWTTVTCTVSGGSGIHDLFLVFAGSGDELFEFNWWKFDGPTETSESGSGGAAGVGGGGVGGGGLPSAGGAAASGGGSAGVGGAGGSASVGGAVGVGGAPSSGGTFAASGGATGAQASGGGAGGPPSQGSSCQFGLAPSSGASRALWLAAGAWFLVRRRGRRMSRAA